MLSDSTNTTISGNIINYNRQGIGLDWANYNVVLGNDVKSNTYQGIYLSYSDDNTISGNILKYNMDGIWLYISYYNTICRNTAKNSRYGIYLYVSDYNMVLGNILLGNAACIHEINCQGNLLEHNDCGIPLVLIISISCISGGAVIGVATFLLIRRKRKGIA